MTFSFRSAIGSHVGMVRSNNQDSGFAGARLFFVADGMGGHAGGDVASALVTKHVAQFDTERYDDPEQAAAALAARLVAANQMLSDTVDERPELSGMGTTFSGLTVSGDRLALAHIGDSRAYLFRDGRLSQLTSDHTFVQRLVDSGQITEEEAKTHPRRSVLMRVLGHIETDPVIDTEVLDTRPGDVWLLCSDGLCGYVDEKVIRAELRKGQELQETVDQLIDRALENGAPDNVTVVLLATDVAPAPATTAPAAAGATDTEVVAGESLQHTLTLPVQRFVGSAAGDSDSNQLPSTGRTRIMGKRRRRQAPVPEAHFEPRVDEYLAELIAETKRRNWRRRALWALGACSAVLLVTLAAFFAYRWTQTLYYVGTDEDSVVIYRGVQQSIGPLSLSSIAEDTNIPVTELDPHQQRQLQRTLSAASLEEAREIIERLGVTSDG